MSGSLRAGAAFGTTCPQHGTARQFCAPRGGMTGRTSLRVQASVTAEKASLDMNKMSPLHDRVLVKPIEEEKKTAGGILLPKGPPKANSDAHFGTVVAVGSEVELPLAKGDTIVFQKYAMAEIEIQDGELVFVAQKSIMGKVE